MAARVLVLAATVLLAHPGAALAQDGPCADLRALVLLCPDLRMKAPYDLREDRRTRRGRVLLRAANAIDSVGLGPMELVAVRDARLSMRVVQRVHRMGGGSLAVPSRGRVAFKRVPGQGAFWKFKDAARFELWRLDDDGERTELVRTGPKAFYCLRDLRRSVGGRYSPWGEIYPACSRRRTERRLRLGTSVGWSDVYPASYHEQWVDVTGLEGTFELVHVADPLDGLEEIDETNNAAGTRVELPLGRGSEREDEDEEDEEYGR